MLARNLLLLLMSASTGLFADGTQPVQRTENTDIIEIAGVSDISTVDQATLAQKIMDGSAAVGLDISPDEARDEAATIIRLGHRAVTVSKVTTQVVLGTPNRRSDRVRIVTIIGKDAPESTKAHENGHRIINQTLADGSYLTNIMNTLARDTQLGADDITDLMNKKLDSLDTDFQHEWDRLTDTFRSRHLARKDIEGIAQAMALLKRDVLIGIFDALVLRAMTEGDGSPISGFQVHLILFDADRILAFFMSLIRDLGSLDAFLVRSQHDLSGLIEDLIRATPP